MRCLSQRWWSSLPHPELPNQHNQNVKCQRSQSSLLHIKSSTSGHGMWWVLRTTGPASSWERNLNFPLPPPFFRGSITKFSVSKVEELLAKPPLTLGRLGVFPKSKSPSNANDHDSQEEQEKIRIWRTVQADQRNLIKGQMLQHQILLCFCSSW